MLADIVEAPGQATQPACLPGDRPVGRVKSNSIPAMQRPEYRQGQMSDRPFDRLKGRVIRKSVKQVGDRNYISLLIAMLRQQIICHYAVGRKAEATACL